MAKKRKNIFEITAYYSGNTCIIDEKHSYKSCEILCKLFNYNADKISEVQRDLKRLLQLLLFKLDDNYDAWKNYDSNVYKTQAHLNWVKDLLLKMPLYKHITHLEDFDYQDLINCLNRHTIMFDRHYNDMCLLASERDEEEKKLDYDANSEYEEDLDDYEDDADDDGEDFDDLSEHYSFYEAPRYESQDLGFNDSLVPYEYNVAKAKELLAEAGYPDGFTTTLYISDKEIDTKLATVLQAQLKDIGITVDIQVIEWGTYLQKTAEGLPLFIMGWTTVTADADNGLYANFHSSAWGSQGNRSFYKNEKVDELLDGGRAEFDQEKRKAMYQEACQIIYDDAGWDFLAAELYNLGLRENVQGFVPMSTTFFDLSTVYFE